MGDSLTTYTTPPPRAEQTGPEAAAPARRASRFDERGIALQTVIIMVVLLAIAGGVAAVLFARANEATTQLDETEIARIDYATINSYSLCVASGGAPQAAAANTAATGQADFDSCKAPS